MIKRDNFSRRRRLGGAIAVAVLCATAGLAAWAAQPPRSPADLFETISIGRADAPVTITEYDSLTCPHCAVQFLQIAQVIKTKYVDTGRVRYVFADMPIENGPAIESALAARCVAKDRYFATLGAIYARQRELRGPDPIGVLREITREQGVTDAQFDRCVLDESRVEAMRAFGRQNAEQGGVVAAPTIIITGPRGNSVRLEGDGDLAQTEAAIRTVLQGGGQARTETTPTPHAVLTVVPSHEPGVRRDVARTNARDGAAATPPAPAAPVVRTNVLAGLVQERSSLAVTSGLRSTNGMVSSDLVVDAFSRDYFNPDLSSLNETGRQNLIAMAARLADSPNQKIVLTVTLPAGWQGNAYYKGLAQRRVRSITTYLAGLGVALDRVVLLEQSGSALPARS